MKTHSTEPSAIAIAAQAKIDCIKNSALFRFGVFMTSAVVGYLFCYCVFMGFRLIPSLTGGAHNNGNPALDVLKILHSGFGG